MLEGFEKATTELRFLRLVMRIGALEKDGKTHLALTAPAPIAVFDMDRGLEGVVEKFADTKEIQVTNFREMPVKTQKDHEAKWDMFEKRYWAVLADTTIRSIIWDTDTEAWEMIRMAYFGKLTQIKSHHYGEVNAVFRKLIDGAFDSNKNLIMLARYRKQYVKKNLTSDDSAWNGKYEPSGFTEAPNIVQVNLRTKLVEDEDGEQMPTAVVVNCRQNMTMNGHLFEGFDEVTFPWIAANIIEGTSPEDWE